MEKEAAFSPKIAVQMCGDKIKEVIDLAIEEVDNEHKAAIAKLEFTLKEQADKIRACYKRNDELTAELRKYKTAETSASMRKLAFGYDLNDKVWIIQPCIKTVSCPPCNGRGTFHVHTTWNREPFELQATCPNCGGKGSVEDTTYAPKETAIVGIDVSVSSPCTTRNRHSVSFYIRGSADPYTIAGIYASEDDCLEECDSLNKRPWPAGISDSYRKKIDC